MIWLAGWLAGGKKVHNTTDGILLFLTFMSDCVFNCWRSYCILAYGYCTLSGARLFEYKAVILRSHKYNIILEFEHRNSMLYPAELEPPNTRYTFRECKDYFEWFEI